MSDHCESNRLNFFITWYVELKITKKISRKKVRIKIKKLPRNDHKYIDICFETDAIIKICRSLLRFINLDSVGKYITIKDRLY